eukprot:5092791-Lingulodinium_polyedra.AAC.1
MFVRFCLDLLSPAFYVVHPSLRFIGGDCSLAPIGVCCCQQTRVDENRARLVWVGLEIGVA